MTNNEAIRYAERKIITLKQKLNHFNGRIGEKNELVQELAFTKEALRALQELQKAEAVKAPVQEIVVVRAKSNPEKEKVEPEESAVVEVKMESEEPSVVEVKMEPEEPAVVAVKVTPEPVPEPIVPIIEKEAVVVPKQEIEISKDIPKGLPNAVFDLVEEWTNKSPDKDRLAEDGDAYCIENDWHYAAGYYIIDDVKGMVRYIHSDAHTVDITLTIAEVQVIRNNGYRY